MPAVARQQYTKPIPPDAARTTMTVKRRGKPVEVPAVRFKGPDGRTSPPRRPDRQAGRQVLPGGLPALVRGTQGAAASGSARTGPPPRSCSRTCCAGPSGEAGMADPHEGQRKRPLVEHVEDFGRHLAMKGSSAYHVSQTTGKLRRCLVEGLDLDRLAQLDAADAADWLAGQQLPGEPAEIPRAEAFTVTDAARLLGLSRAALSQRIYQLKLVTTPRAGRPSSRAAVLELAARQVEGMGEQTAAHYRTALRALRPLARRARQAGRREPLRRPDPRQGDSAPARPAGTVLRPAAAPPGYDACQPGRLPRARRPAAQLALCDRVRDRLPRRRPGGPHPGVLRPRRHPAHRDAAGAVRQVEAGQGAADPRRPGRGPAQTSSRGCRPAFPSGPAPGARPATGRRCSGATSAPPASPTSSRAPTARNTRTSTPCGTPT